MVERTSRHLWVIAHRGASAVAPENTMAAFERAVDLGADFIETDLQLTRDGWLVAMHDDKLDRTSSGRGALSSHTLEEVRQLDAGAWFSRGHSLEAKGAGAKGGGAKGGDAKGGDAKRPDARGEDAKGEDFAGQRIPTLEEVLVFGREKDVGLYLELKSRGPTGAERALVGALHAVQEIRRTVVISFDASSLKQVRQYEPLLVTGLLYSDARRDPVAWALEVGARQLLPRADRVTPALVHEAHAQDVKVVTWTANTADNMRELAAAGVDGIITNSPDLLIKVLAEG